MFSLFLSSFFLLLFLFYVTVSLCIHSVFLWDFCVCVSLHLLCFLSFFWLYFFLFVSFFFPIFVCWLLSSFFDACLYSDERETKGKNLGGGICGRSWGRGTITRIYMYKYIIFSIKRLHSWLSFSWPPWPHVMEPLPWCNLKLSGTLNQPTPEKYYRQQTVLFLIQI